MSKVVLFLPAILAVVVGLSTFVMARFARRHAVARRDVRQAAKLADLKFRNRRAMANGPKPALMIVRKRQFRGRIG